jgi:sugar phosphate isomerase/epimerase
MDITTLPAFTRDLTATAAKIRNAGLEVSGISSSIRLCDSNQRSGNIEEARRSIPVAVGLGARFVRMFGGGDPAKTPRSELAKVGADCMKAILELDGARQIKWVLETHDAWIATRDYLMLLNKLPKDAVGALWDIAHTPCCAGETPSQAMKAFGSRVAYTHIKDAARVKKAGKAGPAWRYDVAPGAGDVPLAEAIGLLKKAGYNGWLVFEHEKRWIAELAEPEAIFPGYATWARQFA